MWSVKTEIRLHPKVKNGCHCTDCHDADSQSIHFWGQTDRRAIPDFLQMNVEECMHCVQKAIPPHFYRSSHTRHQNETNTKHSSECILSSHTSFPHVLFL